MGDREALQKAIELIEARDYDGLLEYIADDFVGVVPPSMSAEPDDYKGHEGVRRYFELFDETIEDLQMSFEIVEDIGDWTLADGRITGKGRASGLPVDFTAVNAVQMRGDKITRMVGWPTLEEAREALARE